MYFAELKSREIKEYTFMEQTLVWKDNNEYKFYVTVILEMCGWRRFDYPAFNYGELPNDRSTDVIAYICRMKEKKTAIGNNQYIIDPYIWDPKYTKHKCKLMDAF